MFRNMTVSLLRHELIKDHAAQGQGTAPRRRTHPDAGKTPSLANRRLAFARLRDREMVTKLFDELGPRYAARNGGYLRILKFGFRQGDNAPIGADRTDGSPGRNHSC